MFMSWNKTVKNYRIKFALIFFKSFLGAYCPGKDRGFVQTFIQKEADVLGVFIAIGNKIRSSDKVQQQMLHKKAQHISAFGNRTRQIGGELSPDNIFSVSAVPQKCKGVKRFYAVTS